MVVHDDARDGSGGDAANRSPPRLHVLSRSGRVVVVGTARRRTKAQQEVLRRREVGPRGPVPCMAVRAHMPSSLDPYLRSLFKHDFFCDLSEAVNKPMQSVNSPPEGIAHNDRHLAHFLELHAFDTFTSSNQL